MSPKTKSSILTTLYGKKYDSVIRDEYFSFQDDTPNERKFKLRVWYAALSLLMINVCMALWL